MQDQASRAFLGALREGRYRLLGQFVKTEIETQADLTLELLHERLATISIILEHGRWRHATILNESHCINSSGHSKDPPPLTASASGYPSCVSCRGLLL